MKLVSASKFARAQHRLREVRSYSDQLAAIFKALWAERPRYSHPLLEKGRGSGLSLLVISANRGLCGSYNAQLAREVSGVLEGRAPGEMATFFVGKKGEGLTAQGPPGQTLQFLPKWAHSQGDRHLGPGTHLFLSFRGDGPLCRWSTTSFAPS